MKKGLLALLSGLLLLALSACSSDDKDGAAANEGEKFTIGFGVGQYEEMFREYVLPALNENGFEAEIITFSQNSQINPSMSEGSIDASIFQDTAYLTSINEKDGSTMIPLTYIPSAPQGIYSNKYTSLDELKDGMTIAVPNTASSLERASAMLEELGLVTVTNKEATSATFNINDIEVHRGLKLKELELAQALVSLDDIDFGIINGNFITDSDRKITDAVHIEQIRDKNRIIVSIEEKNKDTAWAKELKEIYESEGFKDYIKGKEIYDGFVLFGE